MKLPLAGKRNRAAQVLSGATALLLIESPDGVSAKTLARKIGSRSNRRVSEWGSENEAPIRHRASREGEAAATLRVRIAGTPRADLVWIAEADDLYVPILTDWILRTLPEGAA